MKIAFAGFDQYPGVKAELVKIIEDTGHTVVASGHTADFILVPHHLSKYYPKRKPWAGVWIKGGSSRLLELYSPLSKLANKPMEVLLGYKPGLVSQYPEHLLNQLAKLAIKHKE